MNKKALFSAFSGIIFLLILSIAMVFSYSLIKDTGSQYIIAPVADTTTDILANQTNIPAALGTDSIAELKSDYENYNLPIDLMFLALWLIAIGITLTAAFKTTKEGVFSFFGSIFMGSLLVLLITTYLSDFTSWFMAEIFYKVFADTTLSLVIFTFYINNLAIIHFIWWIVLVLLSFIDRGFISRSGRVEE